MVVISFIFGIIVWISIFTLLYCAYHFCRGFFGGFFGCLYRDYKISRETKLERDVIKNLRAVRGATPEHLRMIKEAYIEHYGSEELICQIMCECVDRLLTGKPMEDKDVRTIIKTLEAWNEDARSPAQRTA